MTKEEAIEIVRNNWPEGRILLKSALAVLIPELKESEDERIKKEIIQFLQLLHPQFVGKRNHEEWIAWLEKQGEIDKASYEIAEKEKYDFVSGQYIECRKSFNEFNEDNSYWLEYVGNDTYIGRSDNILNKKFHITPRKLYCLFTQQHSPKEETNAPTAYGKYVDECLNDAIKHFFSEGEDKYSVADLFYAGVRCGKSWVEKQGEQKLFNDDKYQTVSVKILDRLYESEKELERLKQYEQKPADKIEPNFNFKVGQWIVAAGKCAFLITKIDGFNVTLVDANGDESVFDAGSLDDAHLWSIQDAKDGDVLVASDGSIFLFAGVDDCACKYYAVLTNDNNIKINKEVKGGYWETSRAVYPATKEQRESLFQKMKEEGYEWDSKRRDLRKIESKFKVGDWVIYKFGEFSATLQIKNIVDGTYEFTDNSTLNIVDENRLRLWTIKDAKDGDVVALNNEYFLFKNRKNSITEVYTNYCFVDSAGTFRDGGEFFPIERGVKVCPATKEQRDSLMKAMTDAGYTFDFEKKELKEIL